MSKLLFNKCTNKIFYKIFFTILLRWTISIVLRFDIGRYKSSCQDKMRQFKLNSLKIRVCKIYFQSDDFGCEFNATLLCVYI